MPVRGQLFLRHAWTNMPDIVHLSGVKTENGAVLVFTDQCTLGGTGP